MRARKEPPTKEEILRMLASGEVYMLPTAEVEGQFVPQTKEEADAYRNLGFEGAMRMRDMQRSVTGARNRFAEEAMVPAAEAVMNAEGITSLPALAKLLRSPKVIARLLAKKEASDSAKSADMVSQRISSMRDKYGLKSDDLQKQADSALGEGWWEEVQNRLKDRHVLNKIEDLYNYNSRIKAERMIDDKDFRFSILHPSRSILRNAENKKSLGFEPIKKGSPQMNQSGGLIRR